MYVVNNYQNIEKLFGNGVLQDAQDYLAVVMIFKLQPIQTIIWQKVKAFHK